MGGVEDACSELEAVRRWLDGHDLAPSTRSLEALVACEVAQAQGDWPGAQRAAARMIELAERTGREQTALVGHLMLSRVYEMQGKAHLALAQLKHLAAKERRIRSESLASRSTVVSWQLEMRRSEESRRALQVSAQHLERLALEDPMTGIANRRCFEQVAAQSLRTDRDLGGRRLCLALIDVDRFKQVNDGHGHLVGDKVLQVIAALLTEHIRANDLAARLAGDEFVLLLQQTDPTTAGEICERVRHAVADHRWSDLSAGLSVTVSLGVVQSQPGDTLETLLHRGDVAMYRHKAELKREVA
jgi:diguanylate cyclase (GGDEF)-like protein